MMTLTLTADDVAGTWKGTMETQMGPVETTITIKAGEALAGNVLRTSPPHTGFFPSRTDPSNHCSRGFTKGTRDL